MPPSANNAYSNNPYGGRTLSAEGRSYKLATTAQVAQRYPRLMRQVEKNAPYMLAVCFYLPDVLNSGWPKKAQSRYKKFDVDNRLKLLLDALKDACGIDDSQFLRIFVEKRQSVQERTEVRMWNMDKEVRPIGEIIRTAIG